jgi:predicted nucleotidyltransferase
MHVLLPGFVRKCPRIITDHTMKPSDLLQRHGADIRMAASRLALSNVRVFGSVLHGQDTEGSDLDLLVDAPPGTTLFDLGHLQVELEELLGIPVEVLTPQDLPPKFRATVLAEARLI